MLDILDNDPQALIQCTKPGDRVEFALTGVQKFNRTLVIFHELELFTKSSVITKGGNEPKNIAIFTCPNNGPFLTIK